MMHEKGGPSGWVQRFAGAVAPGGAVLDVACGGGRHLRFFRTLGHAVTGVDRNVDGVADLAGDPGVTIVRCDLEADGPAGGNWPLAADLRFAGVVVTNYLYRPLFAALLGALAPGGVLIYETFAVGNARYGRPSNPDFLLRPGELLNLAADNGLMVVAFEQGRIGHPHPAVVQRLCAVRPPALPPDSSGSDDLLMCGIDTVAVDGQGAEP